MSDVSEQLLHLGRIADNTVESFCFPNFTTLRFTVGKQLMVREGSGGGNNRLFGVIRGIDAEKSPGLERFNLGGPIFSGNPGQNHHLWIGVLDFF